MSVAVSLVGVDARAYFASGNNEVPSATGRTLCESHEPLFHVAETAGFKL
jgi:hypothetical protein